MISVTPAAAQQIRDKRHAEELAKEIEAHKKTKGKMRDVIGKTVRSAAVEAGARPGTLDVLVEYIQARVDLDDDLNPFVKDDEGKPRVNDKGERITVEGFIADYLERNSDFKVAAPVKGGKAPGGAVIRGTPPAPTSEREKARAAMEADPSPQTMNTLIGNILSGAGR